MQIFLVNYIERKLSAFKNMFGRYRFVLVTVSLLQKKKFLPSTNQNREFFKSYNVNQDLKRMKKYQDDLNGFAYSF